jgi:hypothetical protein
VFIIPMVPLVINIYFCPEAGNYQRNLRKVS